MRGKGSTHLKQINWYNSELDIWRPPENLNLSEWAEKYHIITTASQEKGPMRMRRTPFLVPILDCFLVPNIVTVVFCKPAQVGGTRGVAVNVVGYYAHQEGSEIFYILADEDTAKDVSSDFIKSMFRASSELEKTIIEDEFTRYRMHISTGGDIQMGWASSPSRLGSRPKKIVILDEVDKPGYYLNTKEASPISLAYERTQAYFERKILIFSTPTVEEGNIWQHLNSCDIIYDWHVPCPYCGIYQPLRWSREHSPEFPDGKYRGQDGEMHPLGEVVWEGGKDATPKQIDQARYQCGTCGELWTTTEKNKAVEHGMMVERREIDFPPKKVGFHVNRIYSLLGDSGDLPTLVDNWIRCIRSGDPRELQGFINSTLALPWKQVIVTTTEDAILQARCDLEPQVVPQQAIALICSIDVQKYGYWFVVRAWARDFTSWNIHYGYLTTWDEVETLLFETTYPIQDSELSMGIWRAVIDTGGGEGGELSLTEQAEFFIRYNMGRGCQLWGTKGASREMEQLIKVGRPLDKTPSGKPIPGGIQIISLNTGRLKDNFHYRLQQAVEGGPRPSYLHAQTDMQYARQILAEEKREIKPGVYRWVKIGDDNHYLDCECMNLAAADPEWPGGGVNIYKKQIPKQPKERTTSAWLSRPKKENWLELKPRGYVE